MIGEVKTITVIKESVSKSFSIDVDQKLNKLRDILIEDGFIHDDRQLNKWRFISPSSSANEVLISEDEIVQKNSERFMIIKEFQNNKNEIRISNVDAKPDLNGIKTDSFSDRYIDVSVALNSRYSQDKFQPLMLKHVRKNNNTYSSYDHVVVCEENSAIQFKISAKGRSGFGFSIKPDKGEYIVEKLYAYNSNSQSNVATIISRYQRMPQNINVVSAETPDIPLSEAVNLQHITITTWRITSFKQKINNTEEHITVEFVFALGNGASIPSSDYQKGQLVKGDFTDQNFGEIYDVKEDTSNILGRIEIDFYIFNSKEAARKVFTARQ